MTVDTREGLEQAIYRFNFGAFECVAINDGRFVYTADQYLSDAAPDVTGKAHTA